MIKSSSAVAWERGSDRKDAGSIYDLDLGDGLTDHIVHLEYVQFILLQLYLNIVRGKMLGDTEVKLGKET